MAKEYTAFNGDAFWNDGYVQDLNMTETAIYFHYITSPRLENSGVYKESQRIVSFYTKVDIEAVKQIDEKLENDGKVYRVGEWVIVPSSLKHQRFEKSENVKIGILKQLKSAPIEVLKILQQCDYIIDVSSLFPQENKEKGVSEDNPETQEEPLPNPSDTPTQPLDTPLVPCALYSDIDIDQDINNVCVKTNEKDSEIKSPEKLFLYVWQHNPDIFNATSRIESPKEWKNFWETSQTTYEQVEIAMNNFIADVKCGVIASRYVPSMPDRFVLKGWINKCQSRFTPKNTDRPHDTAPPTESTSLKKSLL